MSTRAFRSVLIASAAAAVVAGSFAVRAVGKDDVAALAARVTKWLYITAGDDNSPKPTYLGHYDDQFIRENGEWKFLRRESFSDISPLRRP